MYSGFHPPFTSLSPALPHVRPPEEDLKVVVEADGVRGDVGVPRHGHKPLSVQRPHRQGVGDNLALGVVFGTFTHLLCPHAWLGFRLQCIQGFILT